VQTGGLLAEPTALLPGEQEAMQQTVVAGAETQQKLTSSLADGPAATSTPYTSKLSKKKQTLPVS